MKKNRLCTIVLVFAVVLWCVSCGKNHSVPEQFKTLPRKVHIYPDYTDIVIPFNIAPLNFMVRETGEEFVVSLEGSGKKTLVSGSGKDGIIQFDIDKWHEFLQQNKGKSLRVNVYKRENGEWFAFPQYNIQVAEEPIDSYLSYRLIEPGYEIYRLLGLYQRNLTNFNVKTIIENPRLTYVKDKTYCINCHNYQNYSTKRMLFHARSSFGGTIIAENGKIEKLNMKNDSILGAAVYPAWHPTKNWIVFSSNKTGQVFRVKDHQKVEVLDHSSDIIFYNADTHEISNVVKSDTELETFPVWSPSGDKIYYCVSKTNLRDGDPDSIKDSKIIEYKERLKYNLMSLPFDEKTMTFGDTPVLEFDAEALNMSASVPRVSPDGRYLLFTLGEYGQFHIWHTSADLYVKDLQTGKTYPLTAANSSNVDSYHSWSSNGRWIAFSSRRDDGSFTRSYITYFDKSGKAHKAFMLPQEDPTYNIRLFKSFNVPELTKDEVPYEAKQFEKVVRKQKAVPVTYKEMRARFKNK